MPARAKPFPIQPERLALTHLAQFVGLAANRQIVERMREAGFGDVRESHGFLIQHLLAEPRSVGELAQLLGITQQAVSKSVAELTAGGYLETVPADDARVRKLRLSVRGHECVLCSRRLRDSLERRLKSKLGVRRFEQTRSILAELLEALGGAASVRSRRVRNADAASS